MSHDLRFRGVLVALCAVLFAIIAFYRVQSYRKGEQLDRRQEGLFILLTLRPLGLLSLLGLVAWMLDPSWMAWARMPLPDPVRWSGLFVGALAAALFLWALGSLGKNLTDTVVTRTDHDLVTRGPYRFVRHPFYDAVALSVLATSLVAANWFLLLSGALAFALIVLRTRREEERLLARFGEAYSSYRQRTGRFLPRLD